MSTILTCLEQAFEAILDDSSLFLDEEFMMERMFEPITSKIPPLREYLEHIFEIKSAMNVSGCGVVIYAMGCVVLPDSG